MIPQKARQGGQVGARADTASGYCWRMDWRPSSAVLVEVLEVLGGTTRAKWAVGGGDEFGAAAAVLRSDGAGDDAAASLASRHRFMRRASHTMRAQAAMSTVRRSVETASRQTFQVPVHAQPSAVSGPKRPCRRRRAVRTRVRQSRSSACSILTNVVRRR